MRLKTTTRVSVSAIRLRYLYEVVAAGSMRAASDKLGVAPSSVSRQVAQLEEELGLPLIEKGRREIALTEAGEMAVRYYRHQISEEEAFLSELEDLRGLRKGTVVLALGEGFVGQPLSAVLHEFTSRYPDMRLKIRLGGTNEVLRLVAEDEAHLGMALETPVDPKIRVWKAVPQPIKAIVSAKHPLGRKKKVTLTDLARYRLALPPRNFRIRQLIAQAEQKEGVFLTPAITSNSLLILKNFAQFEEGVTLLPELASIAETQAGTLRSIPISNEALSQTQVQIVLRVRRQLPAGVMRLLHLLEGYL